MAIRAGQGRFRHVHGVGGQPHVRVVQSIFRAIAISCVSIQGCGVERRNGGLAGDDGNQRGIEREGYLFWRWRSDI